MISWQKLKSNIYLQYTALFIIIAIITFAVVPISKSTLIWNSDGIAQHYPALVYWHDMLRNLVFHHHMWNQWTWNFGLGSDTTQILSYYVMGDIFTYPVMFFSKAHIAGYYSVMVIVRLFLSGVSFIFVARKLLKTDHNWTVLAGSIVYLFSGYSAYVTFAHPFFINPLIIFPLLVLATYHTQQTGKILGLAIMTCWTLFNSFYLGAVMGIGMAIYYLVSIAIRRDFRTIRKNLKLLLGVIIGVLTSAILFIPSIYQLLVSARSSTSMANGLKVYPISYYLSLPGLTISNHIRPYWVTGAILTLGVIAVVWSMRRFKRYLLLNTIIGVGCIFVLSPILAAILNGGTSPSNRFTFMLLLPIALVTVTMLEHLSEIDLKDLLTFGIVELIIIASLYMAHNFSFKFDLGGVLAIYTAFVVIFILNHYVQNKWLSSTTIAVAILVLVSWNGIIVMRDRHANQFDVSTSSLMSQQSVEQLTDAQNAYVSDDSDSKSRTLVDNQLNDYTDKAPAENLSILANVFNINSYWSLQNKHLGQLNDALENNTSNPNDVTNTADFRNSLLKFLGVTRVFINPDNQLIPAGFEDSHKEINSQRLYTSDSSLPLIYEAAGSMTYKAFNKLDPSQKEVALLNNLVTDKKTTSSTAKSALKKTKQISFDSLPDEQVTTKHISVTEPTTDYSPTSLTFNDQNSYKGYELHARLTNIHYSAGSLSQRYQNATNNYISEHNLQIMDQDDYSNLRYNPSLYKLNWLRQNVMQISSDSGQFSIEMSYNKVTNTFEQEGHDNLSFYHPRYSTTLNLGTISSKHQNVSISLPTSGSYSFDVKLWAVPTGKTVDSAIKQNKAATNIKYSKNQVSAKFNATHKTILATTIPYSTGWRLKGYDHTLPRVNKAFIGIPVHAGSNKIKLSYRTPFAKVGAILSLIGLLSLLVMTITWLIRKRAQ